MVESVFSRATSSINFQAWGAHKADSEARFWVQVVYLEDHSRKPQLRNRNEKIRRKTSKGTWLSWLHWGQLELTLAGILQRTMWNALQNL